MHKSLGVLRRNLEFAAYIMRCLPPVRLQKCRAFWPRLIYTAEELAAQKPVSYYRPTPEEVARMEEIRHRFLRILV